MTAQANNAPRIVSIESSEMWTGITATQDFLELPAGLDLDTEENAWFATGGDTSGKTFAEYLIGKGAKRLDVERWGIRYQ